MDTWANTFWIVIITQIIVIIGIILGTILLVKFKKKKKNSLLSSIKTVFLIYIVFSVAFISSPEI